MVYGVGAWHEAGCPPVVTGLPSWGGPAEACGGDWTSNKGDTSMPRLLIVGENRKTPYGLARRLRAGPCA